MPFTAFFHHFPLFSSTGFDLFVVLVWVLTKFLTSNLSRKVYARIGSDGLTMGIDPVTADMACIVIIAQLSCLMGVCRNVLKERELLN